MENTVLSDTETETGDVKLSSLESINSPRAADFGIGARSNPFTEDGAR